MLGADNFTSSRTLPMSISLRNIGGNALSILSSDVMNRATSFVLYAMVARHLGTKKSLVEDCFRKVAHFAHFENVTRLPGTEEGHPAIVMCEEYQQSAETAFYTDGNPRTYYAGSYFAKENERKRFGQYDMWPDRALDQPALQGRNAVYGGYITRDIQNAFDSVEELPRLDIIRDGLKIRSFRVFRCLNFKGMQRPGGRATY